MERMLKHPVTRSAEQDTTEALRMMVMFAQEYLRHDEMTIAKYVKSS
jgi:hypothetical protein